jgi:cytochrome P450
VSVSNPKFSVSITKHSELKKALRDTSTYSSDLQGDADVRDYRQIPLEVDPPRHHLYRAALGPYFVKPAIEKHLDAIRENTNEMIGNYFEGDPKDVVENLVLPLVMRNLGVIYNRPQDVSEWISWGPDVWTAESSKRDGATLHRYLDRVYEEALLGNSNDIWNEIVSLEIEGVPITPIEFRGIAGVLLAGGRDTVVKLLTGIIWHLANSPSDLKNLRSGSIDVNSAIQEYLRFLSPLPSMVRTTVPESTSSKLPEDRYVKMSFISGNFDEEVFEDPLKINLGRSRNPHLSFGFGPHTCLGNHISEIEAKIFLESLISSNMQWEVLSENILFHSAPLETIPEKFISLKISAF